MNCFFEELKAKHPIFLNDQQRSAVEHGKGPALVLAGPGSGKTTVITARTGFLVLEKGVHPESILTVTFNKAAQLEMKHRFLKLFGDRIPCRNIFSTFHSLCYSVVKDYEKRQGKRLRLIEGETGHSALSKQNLLKEICKEINGTPINEDELETLINEMGFVKNRMIKDFEGQTFQTPNFISLLKAYDEYKKKNLLMDFDDMLIYCNGIFTRCPDILTRYKKRFAYLQVDEGQDLSELQFKILGHLVNPEENNLFVVADDDQSIYGFRGADPRHILELGSAYTGLKLYKLENNYRSSSNIVDISSKLIRNNKGRYDKCHRTGNPEDSSPGLIRVKDEKEQLDFVAEKINEYARAPGELKIAVLYRNNLSSVAMADRLDREGISFKLKQNRVRFFQHWLVQDILAFLRFSLDPCDREAFQRIYSKMNRYLTRQMAESLSDARRALPVIEAVIRSNDLKPYQQAKLHDVGREFGKLSKMSPSRALKYIENDFKFFSGVKEYCDRTGLSFDYLYHLFGILKTLALPCKTLPVFLERLSELGSNFENRFLHEPHEAWVTLSTLHSCKGLEYDIVFMIDLTNNEIPGKRALDPTGKHHDDGLLEEERRLFYVGMTRAKTRLYLVSPASVNGEPVSRSVFVSEVSSLMVSGNDEIGEGVAVRHRKYGKGVIASVAQDAGSTMAEIDFKGRTRHFNLDFCLEKGIIEIER